MELKPNDYGSEVTFSYLGFSTRCAPGNSLIIVPRTGMNTESTKGRLEYRIDERHPAEDPRLALYNYDQYGNLPLDYMVAALGEYMALLSTFDVRRDKTTPIKLRETIDSFLKKHVGVDYVNFAKRIDPKDIDENDFSLTSNPSFKTKLFHYRLRGYLAGLAAAERKGYDVKTLIDSMQKTIIYPIKKEEHEPVFDFIANQFAQVKD